jgi:hypothetical protein
MIDDVATIRVEGACSELSFLGRQPSLQQVAQALARRPDPTLAARSDPWTVDRQLRDQINEHERVLAGRPADPHEALAAALQQLQPAEPWLTNLDAVAAYTAIQLDGHGGLAGLSRRGRQERRELREKLAVARQRAQEARERRDEAAARVAALQREQHAFERFNEAEGWRRDDIRRLHEQVDDHWAQVVAACVRADDPLAFGLDKLRHARATTAARMIRLDEAIPADHSQEGHEAQAQLPTLVRARHNAEAALAASQARFDEASRRRWGRHDHDAINTAKIQVAIATQDLERAVTTERDLREQLARLSSHQQDRQQAIKDCAPNTRSSRPPSHSSTPASTIPARSGSTPFVRTRRLIWSSGSASRRHRPLAGRCGAITPYVSKPPSTATMVSAPQQDGAASPTGRAKKSRSPTAYSKPTQAPSSPPSGPNSPSSLRPFGSRRSET